MNTGPYEEPVEVLISAIEHHSYCPRQCALIHVEGTYTENVYTVRGNLAHKRVDAGVTDVRDGIRAVRDVPVWSERLRIRGKADLVEFHDRTPYPVEYKVGKRRARHPDLQLCAQALCLEEMLNVTVTRGAVYYHGERRRHEVAFDDSLRRATTVMIEAIRRALQAQRLPEAPNDARCRNCSLKTDCLPGVVGDPDRLRGLQGALFVPYGSIDDPE
ncbi:MAG: CRISPR-associated protein Cas4 [Chloroflexota bacterium]